MQTWLLDAGGRVSTYHRPHTECQICCCGCYLSLHWEMAHALGPLYMWIENSAMTAWFDKSDVYFPVDVGVGEPTI